MNDKSRAGCYVLLAQGLAYPHPTFPDELRQSLDTLAASDGADSSLAGEFQQLAAGLEEAAALPLDALQCEHTGLFVNNHPHVPCPPYESAYREKMLMGSAAISVAQTYKQWGLQVSSELADYAGAELEFMAFAIRVSSSDEGVETLPIQQAFLREHMLPWMPRFARDIQTAAELSAYRALGTLLDAFLSLEDKRLLADTPEGSVGASHS
jgi:TorA maturation chaperone TorD